VKNNVPLAPILELLPIGPGTGDNIQVNVTESEDVETTLSFLKFWYYWYKDDNYMAEYENKTSVSYTSTTKGETWRCVVYPFDDIDIGPPGQAEITILNSPPELKSPLGSLTLNEDGFDNTSIKLNVNFIDIDDDNLIFAASGQEKVEVNIDPVTGYVSLKPEANWFGTEKIMFSASDTEYKINDNLTVTVLPQNDPPVLKKAGNINVSSTEEVLNISVNEGNWLNLEFTAEDIDGDTVTYSTNRTDREDDDDILEFNLDKNLLKFKPRNDHVGSIPVKLSISDSNGSIVNYNVMINVINVNNPPYVSISTPKNNTHFEEGKEIDFKCIYSDPDLLIPDSDETLYFNWTSSASSEPLGSGLFLTTLSGIKFSPGTYTITVTVKDKAGIKSESKITVIIDKKVSKSDDEEQSAIPIDMSDVSSSSLWILMVIIIVITIILRLVFMKKRKKPAIPPEYLPQTEEETDQSESFEVAKQIEETPTPEQLPAGEDAVKPSHEAKIEALPPPEQAPKQTAEQPAEPEKPPVLPPPQVEQSKSPEEDAVQEAPKEQTPEAEEISETPKTPEEEPGVEVTTEPQPIETFDETDEVIKQIERLGELKEKGLLSEEEFEREKAELLR
jgi:hypothetical protein